MARVVVALGSNVDPQGHLERTFAALAGEYAVLARSVPRRTAPIGPVSQPDFYNAVVLLETSQDRTALTRRLKAMEQELGRLPRPDKWGPREIDIDILIWDGQVVNNDYFERDFLRQGVEEVLSACSRRCY